jgi:hypothetical protein
MILVRDVFRAKFGCDREAIAVLKEGMAIISRLSPNNPSPRLLVDFAGPFYTFTLETLHESLADYEQGLSRLMADDEYPSWFGRVVAVMEGGHREFHAVVG